MSEPVRFATFVDGGPGDRPPYYLVNARPRRVSFPTALVRSCARREKSGRRAGAGSI